METLIQPKILKGFRDFLPEAEIQRSLLIEKLTKTFRSYGFVPIDTPVLEYSEILEKNEDELSKLKEFENYFIQKKQIEENRKKIKRELDEINNEKALLAEDCVFYKIKNKNIN